MASTHPTIGRKIRSFRAALDLSLRDLGAKTGIQWSLIARWERREADPSFGQTEKLAEAFGIPVSWLWSPDPLPEDRSRLRVR